MRFGWRVIAFVMLLTPFATLQAQDRYASPQDFAEALRVVLAKRDVEAFLRLNLTYGYWSADAARHPDYLRYLFGETEEGASIPKLMARGDLTITTVAVSTPHTFEGADCPIWTRYVALYSIGPGEAYWSRYQSDDPRKLTRDWRRTFVETVFYRCRDRYRLIGTAFYFETSMPWIGDYG